MGGKGFKCLKRMIHHCAPSCLRTLRQLHYIVASLGIKRYLKLDGLLTNEAKRGLWH